MASILLLWLCLLVATLSDGQMIANRIMCKREQQGPSEQRIRICTVDTAMISEGPYLECNSTTDIEQEFCIASDLRLATCTMDRPGSFCSHWTPDKYLEFADIDNSTQLQILHTYIPITTDDDGCLESVSMVLQTLYKFNTTHVGQGHGINSVLQIVTHRRRALLMLSNIYFGLDVNFTTIEQACQVKVNIICCCSPTICNIEATPPLPTTSHQPLPGIISGAVGGVLGVVIVTVLLLIVVKVQIQLRRKRCVNDPIQTAVYDYVGPPELPPRRPREVFTSNNTAYSYNTEIETNSASVSSIQTQKCEKTGSGSHYGQNRSYVKSGGDSDHLQSCEIGEKTGSDYDQIQSYEKTAGDNDRIQRYEKANGDNDQIQRYEMAGGDYDQIQSYEKAGGDYDQIQRYEMAGGDYDQIESYEKAGGDYDHVQSYEKIGGD